MTAIVPWREVEPLRPVNGDVAELLAAIDGLRRIWEGTLTRETTEEFDEARRRTLRRHAIETGIIERLYEVDLGVTRALVREGLTLEVAEREGGISLDTLAVIQDQYEALEFLADAVSGRTPLTLHFIRQLHQLITRHQETYEARDQLGRAVHARLEQGQWKTHANHVHRPDGSLLEYTPPEHVQAEMERLVREYEKSAHDNHHPIVRASWLHHQFIRIHPFADGNGRVARALTLLDLLANRYAPIVVDRRQRADYISALDTANDGDLRVLVRFLARLERIALTSELTPPAEVAAAGASVREIARAYADRLRVIGEGAELSRAHQAESLADRLHGKLHDLIDAQAAGLREAFGTVDPGARASAEVASPPMEEAQHWRIQLINAAKAVDFYANLRSGAWWVRLHLVVFGQRMRYLVAVQRVGRGETGVLAVTAWAETVESGEPDSPRPVTRPLLDLTPDDSVTIVYTDDADERWSEIEQFVERTLAAAVDRFGRQLG